MKISKPLEAGQEFGRLTVIKLHHIRKLTSSGRSCNIEYYLCSCSCGNIAIVQKSNLVRGHTKSCGCYGKETSTQNVLKNKTHGLTRTRIYKIYKGMKRRCLRESEKAYKYYGARGVTICEEWLNDFLAFYNWSMKNGYSEELSIDRIDYNGNYEPNNCRWTSAKEQANNTRRNHSISYNGETHNICEWENLTGIDRHAIKARIEKGWSLDKVFGTPTGADTTGQRLIEYNGEVHNLSGWARKTGISIDTLHRRINYLGWSIEKTLTTPVKKRKDNRIIT